MWRWVALLALVLSGCKTDDLLLRYRINGLELSTISRVETVLLPLAPQEFVAERGEQALHPGESYRVERVCPSEAACRNTMIIEQAVARGFLLSSEYELRFRASQGAPQQVVVRASAIDQSGVTILARSAELTVSFSGGVVDLLLAPKGYCGTGLCGPDEACCAGACRRVSDSPTDCGDCGLHCADNEACAAGECRCGAQPACQPGQACCGDRGCSTLESDPLNCGACGKSCRPGETCAAGVCGCAGGAACGAGQKCCTAGGAGCVALDAGCPCGTAGGVGRQCAAIETCCDPSAVDNMVACADLATSAASCGACGKSCAPGLGCIGGRCSCGASPCDQACCQGTCEELRTDEMNCGGCGIVCAAGQTCVDSSCRCGKPGSAKDCATGELCCNDTCVTQDSTRCGACDASCPSGEACAGGACQCPVAGHHCAAGESCCGDGCFSLTSDSKHCGSCGKQCAANESCLGGVCQVTGCLPACTNNGNSCTGTTCSCAGGAECAAPSRCCPNNPPTYCRNLLNDPTACGGCANVCRGGTPGETCMNGSCSCPTAAGQVGCGAGRSCCQTGCSDLGDSANCGACGIACGANEVCDNGGRCLCVYGGQYGGASAGASCATGTFCSQAAGGCTPITGAACPVPGSPSGVKCSGNTAGNIGSCCASCPAAVATFCGTPALCAASGCTAY